MKKLTLVYLAMLAVLLPTTHAADGLVAYWPFDTDFTNAEGASAFDGTPTGRAEISSDDVKAGSGALKIDDDTKTRSHVTVPGDLVGSAPVVRTVVGWYKYSDISGDGSDARNAIWETQPTYSLSFGIRNGTGGKYSQWYFDAEGGAIYGDGPTVSDGQWHHTAVVWNSVRGHIKYYHDGALYGTVAIDTRNNPVLGQAGFNIGTHRAADGTRNWDGFLDEVAVFGVELTPEQVLALCANSETISPLNVLTEVPELAVHLIRPVEAKVYPEDAILSWEGHAVGEWTYDLWLGTDPNELSVVASGLSQTAYAPENLEGGRYYWQVTASSELGAAQSEIASFEVHENRGLVAYWPFDVDYRNAQGDSRYDGVKVDDGNGVRISSEDVVRGAGALRIDDNDLLTHGFVQVAEIPFFAGQKTLTAVAWYKYKDIAGDGSTDRPFVFETAPNNAISYGMRFENEGLDVGEWYLRGTPGFSDTSGPIDSNEAWHHVALVYDAIKGSAKFYFDGELRDYVLGNPYQAFGDGFMGDEVLHIGDFRGGDGTRMFDGFIDDMAAYDVALSGKQIKAVYDGTYEGQVITPVNVLDAINDVYARDFYPVGERVPVGAGLSWEAPTDVDHPEYHVYFGADPATVLDVVYAITSEPNLAVELEYGKQYFWKVDVVSGTDVFAGDLMQFSTVQGLLAYYPFDTDFANAQGNTLYDAESIGPVETSGEDVAVGGGALKIDNHAGTANLVTINPSPLAAGQRQLTVTGWYKFRDISADGTDTRPFVLESSDYHVSYGLRWENDMLDGGEWYLRGSPGFSETVGPMITPEDPWHHFALVYDADSGYAEFYFDGQLQGHYDGTPGTGLNGTTCINIGDYRSGDGGRNFDGYIDDVAFFDVVLSADQIKAMYDNAEAINGGNILDQDL